MGLELYFVDLEKIVLKPEKITILTIFRFGINLLFKVLINK